MHETGQIASIQIVEYKEYAEMAHQPGFEPGILRLEGGGCKSEASRGSDGGAVRCALGASSETADLTEGGSGDEECPHSTRPEVVRFSGDAKGEESRAVPKMQT